MPSEPPLGHITPRAAGKSLRQRMENAAWVIDQRKELQYWMELAQDAGIQGDFRKRQLAQELREMAIDLHTGRSANVVQSLQTSYGLDETTAVRIAQKVYAAIVPDTIPPSLGR